MLELNKIYQGDCLELMKEIDDKVAKSCNQVVGTRNDFYITLKQLMEIMS
jgi:DNA modification methylase